LSAPNRYVRLNTSDAFARDACAREVARGVGGDDVERDGLGLGARGDASEGAFGARGVACGAERVMIAR